MKQSATALFASIFKEKKQEWLIFILSSLILVTLDLLLKSWAAASLRGQPDVVLLKGLLGLTYVENNGALFGFMSSSPFARWPLAIVKIAILGGILWYYHFLPAQRRLWIMRAPIILVFAGGLGNLVDRVAFGYVRDMFDFLFMNFAIFNLADVYVTVGVFCILAVTFFVDITAP
ncbi:MAG: signal peptidase II [Defluviitaleaceae bacterium]|nr:signal peptidase II [Defluviitaleaceae bacterium]